MHRTTRLALFAAVPLAALAIAADASAAPYKWTVQAAPSRATTSGGPWVLAEGTTASPLAGFPAPNAGTASMQPYYQALTTGTDQELQGYFDYRVKDTREAIVAARSIDGARTWTFQSMVLQYDSPSLTDAGAASDDGEGHPFVLTTGRGTFLYTLDRSPANVDAAGLIVRTLMPTAQDPLAGAPAVAEVGSTAVTRTVGLANPDGILALVPGASSPAKMLYLQKDLTTTPYVTTVHLVETNDGVTFTNDRVVTGLTDATTTFIGPRGTLVKYADGRFGLFYSAGLAGEDADAFHYLGYAESTDLVAWTVVNGVDAPLASIDFAKDPTGGQPWYAGRVYAPSVTFAADGCSATLVFSGYKTTKPKAALNDYRQIGRATLARACGGVDAGAGADAGTDHAGDAGADHARDAGALADASPGDAGGSGDEPHGTGESAGCSSASAAPPVTSAAVFLVGACAALLGGRRRRR